MEEKTTTDKYSRACVSWWVQYQNPCFGNYCKGSNGLVVKEYGNILLHYNLSVRLKKVWIPKPNKALWEEISVFWIFSQILGSFMHCLCVQGSGSRALALHSYYPGWLQWNLWCATTTYWLIHACLFFSIPLTTNPAARMIWITQVMFARILLHFRSWNPTVASRASAEVCWPV